MKVINTKHAQNTCSNLQINKQQFKFIIIRGLYCTIVQVVLEVQKENTAIMGNKNTKLLIEKSLEKFST
jgi:hypothetical protein